VFRANIANLIGWGEHVTKRRDGGWSRDKYRWDLEGHIVTIKQRKSVLNPDTNKLRGRWVDSSLVTITKINSLDEGISFTEDLCWLLTFATQSSVTAYDFHLGRQRRSRSSRGTFNGWREPFHSGIGSLSDFIVQVWPTYRRLKTTRPLASFIHMIDNSDLSGGVLEVQIAATFLCLESIKSYFALIEGGRHGISEDRQGRFLDRLGHECRFRKLLELTFKEVGMPLPPSLDKIVKLRNALIHRGFIREQDKVTRYIFGALSAGAMHTAMFEVMEEAQDALREYMLRLLGYRGDYCSYSNSGMSHKTIA
jgi:hypothetical protein